MFQITFDLSDGEWLATREPTRTERKREHAFGIAVIGIAVIGIAIS